MRFFAFVDLSCLQTHSIAPHKFYTLDFLFNLELRILYVLDSVEIGVCRQVVVHSKLHIIAIPNGAILCCIPSLWRYLFDSLRVQITIVHSWDIAIFISATPVFFSGVIIFCWSLLLFGTCYSCGNQLLWTLGHRFSLVVVSTTIQDFVHKNSKYYSCIFCCV